MVLYTVQPVQTGTGTGTGTRAVRKGAARQSGWVGSNDPKVMWRGLESFKTLETQATERCDCNNSKLQKLPTPTFVHLAEVRYEVKKLSGP